MRAGQLGDWLGVGAIFAVCVALNLTKAVHVDDAAYLEIASAILADPLHAMNALVSWGANTRPIHELNQPHLYFWWLAGGLQLFGSGETALHAFTAPFTLLALLAFHALARRACPERPLALTALFALGPAFIPGQNLMVDIPLLGPWLLFFVALPHTPPGTAPGTGEDRPPWLAATAAAAACLIKYTGLVLVVALLLDCVARRAWRSLISLAIPFAALGAWSLLNWFDYGAIHLFDRPAPEGALAGLVARPLEWTVALGAALPAALLLGGDGPKSRRVGVWVLAVATGVGVGALAFASPLCDGQGAAVWGLLAANGIVVLDWLVSLISNAGWGRNRGPDPTGTADSRSGRSACRAS
jgi:hypothetical protein